MPQQGACRSELFRVMIVTECSSYFGSPGAWPKAHCLIFVAVSFHFYSCVWKQTWCSTIFAFRVFSFSVRVCLFAALRQRYFPLRIWLAIRHSVEQPRAPCLAWMSSECCSAREVVHLALHCRRWCAASTAHVREELNGKMREIISVRRMSFMGTKMRVTKRMFLSNICSSFEIEKDVQVEHD